MQKRLLVLVFLLTILVNISSVKGIVFAFLSKSLYFPFLYSRNLLILLTQEERRSTQLSIQNQKLREILIKSDSINTLLADTFNTYVGEILHYVPLGIPEEIIVKIKSPKMRNLIEGTVVDLFGVLVGSVDMQKGEQLLVKTIFNENYKVGVECIDPYYTGVLKGGEIPIIFFIPIDASIKIGDTLYTSRLSSYAKPYVPVGIVKEYQKDEDNPIFYKAKIEPFFKPFTSRIVLIYGK